MVLNPGTISCTEWLCNNEMNTDLWKLYILYTKIWLGQKKINTIQCEKFFDQATLNQESTVL